MKKINWGIIGAGDVAEVKSGPAFQKVENSQLLAVMRRDGEKPRILPKDTKFPNGTTTAINYWKTKK